MNILRIERKQNISTVAALYDKLKSHVPDCAIQVPTDLDEYRLCGKGDFLQFLLTWSEKCPDSPVVTHITSRATPESVKSQLRRLFSEEHGFLLGLLTRKFGLSPQRGFLNAQLREISTPLVESAFKSCRIFEDGEPIVKGGRAFVAIDDLIDQRGQILSAYTNVYRRRNPNYSPLRVAFAKLLLELFGRTPGMLPKSHTAIPVALRQFLDQVTEFTYELFENADRWGARPYDKNVRGILLHIHFRESLGQKPLHQQVGEHNPLSQYLRTFIRDDGYERTPFLELTIFDNGPALAAHYLSRKPKAIREEFQATIDCLLLASGRSDKSSEGKGLYETMKLLNETRGFLRYRGKRLALYRNFIIDPLDPKTLGLLESQFPSERRRLMREALFLRDWKLQTSQPAIHSEAVGAFFTIIVPIEGLSQ